MIDKDKIKSAAQGYCDATYGTLNEYPLIAEAFKQGVNWAIQQFLKDNCHSLTENFGSRNDNVHSGRSIYYGKAMAD